MLGFCSNSDCNLLFVQSLVTGVSTHVEAQHDLLSELTFLLVESLILTISLMDYNYIKKPDPTTGSRNREVSVKIGELARKANCPVETVRYYEKQGLLPKAKRESANNYRYYAPIHLERLLFIRHCRALDMTQDEIRTLLQLMSSDSTSCSPIVQVISEHLKHVQERIKELKLLERELELLKSECESGHELHECGIVKKLKTNKNTSSISISKNGHLGGVH